MENKKKEYTKPTIEGELFVASEYIAACWQVTDANGKVWYTDFDPKRTPNNIQDDGFFKAVLSDNWYYSADRSEDAWLVIAGASHRISVTIQSAKGTSHPNASV